MTSATKTALGLGALLLGLVLAFLLTIMDEPVPDISDLPEVRPTVADADNAFTGLLAVAESLAKIAETDPRVAATLTESQPAHERDAAELEHLRSVTAHLMPPWKEALSRPASVAPALLDANNPPFDISKLHKLGRWMALLSAPVATASPDAVVDHFADSLRAAHHIAESNDSLINYITGIACTHLTLRELERFAADTTLTPELARRLIEALERARLSPEALAGILHNEAHFTLRNAAALDTRKYVEGMLTVGVPAPPPGALFFNKPNQSARWWMERLRSALAQIDAKPVATLVVPKPDRGSPTLWFGLAHPNNAFGRHYWANEFFDFSALLRLRPLLNARLSALQAWMALRAEQDAHGGELPESLAPLVPTYFSTVPIDDADGGPIRYSRERAVVWSIGTTDHEPAAEPTSEPLTEIEYRL